MVLYRLWAYLQPICRKPAKRTIFRTCPNQPEVSLYLNGNLVETQNGENVFKFKVTLIDGENKLEVKAGHLADEAVIVRTDEDHPEYVAPKVDTKNWF